MPTRSILISGASSGIGRALALSYAEPGVRLAITGRNQGRLDEVAARCRSGGADLVTASLDVRQRHSLGEWIRSVDDQRPIDLVIANAGVASGLGGERWREDPDKVRTTIAINLIGLLNTIDPLVERMSTRRRGHIALIGSIGGILGAPYMPAYCASKAAVHVYAEALRGNLRPRGVTVTLIVPGYVATPMLNGVTSPKRPFEMSDIRAASIIRRGLDRQRSLIAFPRVVYYGTHLLRMLPSAWIDRLFNALDVDVPETKEQPIDP